MRLTHDPPVRVVSVKLLRSAAIMHSDLPRQNVVLLGMGHTNAHVLRMWRMQPPTDARLTCVSNSHIATYSGMLPGVLAGQYPVERMQIDLVRLCSAAHARLIVEQPTGIDLAAQRLLFADRPAIPFDVLSIGVGSVPTTNGVATLDESVVTIKPMQTFLPRLEARLRDRNFGANAPVRIAVVGGGAGGVEIALAVWQRLCNTLGATPLEVTLVNAAEQLVGGVTEKTSRTMRRELDSRGVRLVEKRRVASVSQGRVTLEDGTELAADVVIWATSAVGSTWLKTLGLPTDDKGFLLIRDTLQTVGHDAIFAVGDSGTLQHNATPKAGVYAVRQGPILWDNIQRVLRREPLRPFLPQGNFLKLLNLGDGRAIGEYKGLTLSGRWVWRWKDRIDSRFMDMYQDYRPMSVAPRVTTLSQTMRCAGCGGKIGGSVLSRVLARLEIPRHAQVELGLEAPDDAAIVRLPPGKAVNVSVDFFAAPFDDPFTVGRIAALHAASDCFATGAKPVAALASITIPVGSSNAQEQLLHELLAGALQELKAMNATLAGGHTIEGPQVTVGFTMVAEQRDPPRTKGKLRAGDALILTKPLGTGVLLAAHVQARCRADWFQSLVESMLHSNQFAAELCEEFSLEALTDVTGFGLAGHLLEMLRAGQLSAELHLSRVPLLPGAEALLCQGLESTLAPANRDAESDIDVSETLRPSARYAALFDPQTSGGMLLGVPAPHVEAVLTRLAQHGVANAAVIGHVVARDQQPRLIHVSSSNAN